MSNDSASNHPSRGASLHSRFLGAWWGLFIGDALALPADGYFNLKKLQQDYPNPGDYATPVEPHPHSEMHRVSPDSEADLLFDCVGERRKQWGKPGVHYHHGMRAGDNTLSAFLTLELAGALVAQKRFDRNDWLERYKRVMLTQEGHRDFYIPGAHRVFFNNLGRSLPIERCSGPDSHVSGLVEAAALLFFRVNDSDRLFREVGSQIGMVRSSPSLVRAATLVGDIFRLLLSGLSIDRACFEKLSHHHHPYLAYPYHRWLGHHTLEHIAVHELSQGAACDDAVPLALCIALKHADDFERAVTVNASLGGDCCHRGSLVGMLLGASLGCEGIPRRLVNGLVNREAIAVAGDGLWLSVS